MGEEIYHVREHIVYMHYDTMDCKDIDKQKYYIVLNPIFIKEKEYFTEVVPDLAYLKPTSISQEVIDTFGELYS